MSNTNYSYETSLPAFHENAEGKEVQKDMIYSLIIQSEKTCLKTLEKLTGLPQSTIAGRINDLVKEEKVMYKDKGFIEGRLRKLIVPTKAA